MRSSLKMTLLLGVGIAVAAACGGGQKDSDQPQSTATATATAESTAGATTTATATATATSTETASATATQSSTASAAPTAASTAKPTASASSGAKAWRDMNHAERDAFMKKEVMPKMGKLLTEFDNKKFAKVTCGTCHGKDPQHKMPNASLPKLSTADGFKAHKAKDAKMVEFMMTTFTPEMVKVLGVEGYDPAKNAGFGCFGCHVPAN